MLHAAHRLNGAAFGLVLSLCLVFGLGDIVDERLLTPLHWLLWVAVGVRVLSALLLRQAPPVQLALPLAVWLAVLFVAALLAPAHQSEALATILRPLSGALLAWTVYACTASRSRWLAACIALACGGALVAVVGLVALSFPPVNAALASLHDANVAVADVPRLAGTLSHPNVAAIVLELTLPLVLAMALGGPRAWRPIGVGLLLVQLLALTLTFSRAGILAGSIALALLAVLAVRRGAPRLLAPIGLAALVGPLGVLLASGAAPQVERRLLAEMETDGYQARYDAPVTVAAAPEQVLDVAVRVTNVSASEWTALDPSRVALGYHLLRSDGTPIAFDCPATLLPANVPPNTSLDVVAQVHAPPVAGAYLVEWDALREGVAWFSWRGSPTTPMNLLVVSAPAPALPVTEDELVTLPRPARVQYWSAALGMLRDFPLFGVGPDNFRLRFADYSGIDESHLGTHAHSLYLESLADSGVVGFVALVAVLLSLVRACSGAISAGVDAAWLWRAALVASLAAWLVHGLLDDFERFWPAHVAYWLVVGLLVRAGTRQGADRVE